MKYNSDFSTHVCGIPCGVVVESFTEVKPDYTSWASPEDYYGYTESEWFLVDRKGYKADWLERKMNDDDRDELEIEVKTNYRSSEQCAKEDYYG